MVWNNQGTWINQVALMLLANFACGRFKWSACHLEQAVLRWKKRKKKKRTAWAMHQLTLVPIVSQIVRALSKSNLLFYRSCHQSILGLLFPPAILSFEFHQESQLEKQQKHGQDNFGFSAPLTTNGQTGYVWTPKADKYLARIVTYFVYRGRFSSGTRV